MDAIVELAKNSKIKFENSEITTFKKMITLITKLSPNSQKARYSKNEW